MLRSRALPTLLASCCVLAGLAVPASSAFAASTDAYLTQFTGEETATTVFAPFTLAANSNGDVFVPDGEHGVVDEFEPSASTTSGYKLVHEITGAETAASSYEPYSLAVSTDGDLYIGDIQHGGVVDVFEPSGSSASGYTLIHEITGPETTAKEFYPYALAVDQTSGDVYVGDIEHGGVVDEFEPSASTASGYKLVHEITGLETVAEAFSPDGLAVASGHVYVADDGHGVVDEFEPSGATPSGYKLAGELNGTETPQGSFGPFQVALAPTGEIYVADLTNFVVDRFSAVGAYECQITGSSSSEQCGGEAGETPQESLGLPFGLAIGPSGDVYVGDAEHDVVDVFGTKSAEGQWTTTAATAVTSAGATLNGIVNPEGNPVTTCEFEYGTTSSYGESKSCEQTEADIGSGTSPVPVSAKISVLQPHTKYYFRVTGSGAKGAGYGEPETLTTMATPPRSTIKPVTGTSAHCATFNGEVDPDGFATSYQFEDSTNGTEWTALERANIGEGTTMIPVRQEVCGLAGSSTYRVRLKAENSGGEVTSGEATFTTTASAPQLSGVGATVLAGNEATLYATINPEGQQTKYRVEYGATASYGQTAPVGDGDAGATPSQVDQTVAELAAGTTYHFRFVAMNGTGTIYGDDETFSTPLVVAGPQVDGSDVCTNEAVRGESNGDPSTGLPYSSELPDCRADEQVTPPLKGDDGVGRGSWNAAGGDTTAVEAVSANGTPLLLRSLVPLDHAQAGTNEELNPATYDLTRSSSGWVTTGLTPPPSTFATAKVEWTSNDDVAAGLWSAATPAQSLEAESFYRHDASGAFVDIGPIAPPAATTGPPRGSQPKTDGIVKNDDGIVGASVDLEDVLFQLASPILAVQQSYLWPGDSTVFGARPSLYEYVGSRHTGEGTDVPALVGVDNQGKQISECGTGLGAVVEYVGRFGPVRNGISAGGSTVFFSVQAGGCEPEADGPANTQAYGRIGTPGSPQATVNLAGSSGCSSSTACNVTNPVTFQGASSDGSKVFFTAAQAGLIHGDTDASNALYECELPGDGGATPTASGKVDPCPALKALTLTGTAERAEVQKVVAVSEEGSRIYFTATGALTSEPNQSLPAAHQVAEAGKDNLYLWEALGNGSRAGRIAFVATLPSASPNEAQSTPDGGYLVFTTTGDLTSDDTSTAGQAFRYDALTGDLIRISVGENGYSNDGNTSSDTTTLATERLVAGEPNALPKTISENGAYVVFQTSAALTPQVDGGTNNVYEWHEGNVYLISDGTDNTDHAGLIGMDASGENIFFVTADKLVGQDTDEDYDVYDARIEGGFPAPNPPATCGGEACQGSLTAPLTPAIPGSSGSVIDGNLTSPGLRLPGETPAPRRTRKPLTRAQKLRKALHSCHNDKRKAKRRRCERAATKRYGKVHGKLGNEGSGHDEPE
jgi:hypothetical protein